MDQIPAILYGQDVSTWLIIGASRGIGLEFVRQLLTREERIIATVRDPQHASGLWSQAGSDHGRCQMMICDILSEDSINVQPPVSYFVHGLRRFPHMHLCYTLPSNTPSSLRAVGSSSSLYT